MKKRNKGFALLEAAFTLPVLLILLLFIIGLFIRQFQKRNVDLYAEYIARSLVVCSSMEDAQGKADELAGNTELSYLTDFHVQVDYLPGSRTEWRKGNYIQISFTGKLTSILLFGEKEYQTSISKMVEKNETIQN